MAHLNFEYSANLEPVLDFRLFVTSCAIQCVKAVCFPLGAYACGARVDVCAVADGNPHLGFVDMIVGMGQGRDADTRHSVTETLYAAAEAWLKSALDDRPACPVAGDH